MSVQNMQQLAKKMYYEEDFFALVLRNPDKALKSFGAGAFDAAEKTKVEQFAAQTSANISAQIDQLGGGGILDLGNGCGVWC